MEFTDFQAGTDYDNDDSEFDPPENNADKNFLGDSQQQQCTSLNFYRKSHNQLHEIFDALNNRSDDNCKLDTRDLQHEMYWEIDRSFV